MSLISPMRTDGGNDDDTVLLCGGDAISRWDKRFCRHVITPTIKSVWEM